MEQNYFVYKLYHDDYPEFYIGSTKDMKHRKECHKYSCNNPNSNRYNLKVYEYIRSNGGYSSWKYEILEYIRNSINVYELKNLERKYIEELKPSLNREIPNRTKKEWNKQHYENNKELIKQKANEKFDCICGSKYTRSHKARHMKTRNHQNFINQ